MDGPQSIPRRTAERVLTRAAELDREREIAADDGGYTTAQLRDAAREVGLDQAHLDRAAAELLEEQERRAGQILIGYGGATGIIAAVAAGGLIASGQPHLAAPFLLLDLVLLVRVVGRLDAGFHARALPLRAFAESDAGRSPGERLPDPARTDGR